MCIRDRDGTDSSSGDSGDNIIFEDGTDAAGDVLGLETLTVARLKDAEKNNDLTYWYHIQPDWIDLSFFYENVFHYIDDNVMQKIKTQNNYIL